MNRDYQGPPVTYSEAASRSPRRVTTSLNELEMCDMRIKIAAHEREKEAMLKLPSTRSGNRNGTNKPP